MNKDEFHKNMELLDSFIKDHIEFYNDVPEELNENITRDLIRLLINTEYEGNQYESVIQPNSVDSRLFGDCTVLDYTDLEHLDIDNTGKKISINDFSLQYNFLKDLDLYHYSDNKYEYKYYDSNYLDLSFKDHFSENEINFDLLNNNIDYIYMSNNKNKFNKPIKNDTNIRLKKLFKLTNIQNSDYNIKCISYDDYIKEVDIFGETEVEEL